MGQHALLYDDDCGFCRWSVAKILSWDRRKCLRPIPLQSREADVLLGGMDRDHMMASWHLVGPDGTIWSKGSVAGPLFRLLPGGTVISLIAKATPRVTDRVYGWVSERREFLGRLLGEEACGIHPADRRQSKGPFSI